MWTETTKAVIKAMRLGLDETGEIKLCTLTLEQAFDPLLAYGLPHGKELVKALEYREYERVQMRLDAATYTVTLTSTADGEVLVVPHAKFGRAVLSGKEDKASGDVELRLQSALEFQWSDAQVLFLAHHMNCRVEVHSVKEQTEMPFDDGKKGRKPKAEPLSSVKAREARAAGKEDWVPPMWRCQRCQDLVFEKDLAGHCKYHEEEPTTETIARLFRRVEVQAPAVEPAAA